VENKILSALISSRDAYDTVAEYLDLDSFSPAGSTIFRFVSEYYDTDKDIAYCDPDILRSMIESNVAEGAMQDQMMDVLSTIEDKEVSISNVVKQVLEKQRRDLGQQLAQAILTDKSERIIEDTLEQYQSVLHRQTLDVDVDEEYSTPDLEELVGQHFSVENMIPIAPKSLNEKLGDGVPPGTHIVLSARPEAGKTATAVTISCAAALKGFKVLYYANEEPVVNIILRAVSNLSGMSVKQIREEPSKAQALANDRGFGNMIFVYASRNSPWEIKALCKKHEPKLVVVDQLRNINLGLDKLTEILERGAKAMRDIAAQCHCVVVSITQAGDSAEGKAELGMSDIDSSKTGIQGACDVILLMGNNIQLANSGRRCFNLVKNKASGYHGSWYININEQLSRITD
jgi:replicative DNA helicase